MKISDASSVSNKSTKVKKKTQTSGTGFASFLSEGEETKVSSTTQVAPIAAVNIINEVEESDPEQRKKQAIQRGNDILDELEKIRDGLLTGTLSENDLHRAYKLATSQKDLVEDSELNFLINEIEVRTAVELAKRGLL